MAVELTRTVRFAVNDGPPLEHAGAVAQQGANTFAGLPSMTGAGRHYELEIRCRGEPDPQTGYFQDIRDIDAAARRDAIPAISAACRGGPAEPAAVLAAVFGVVSAELRGTVVGVRWRLSPYHSIEMEAAHRNIALWREMFEFSAAHRLHVPSLSDAENRRIFGKCNNPLGHGHNYKIEPCIEAPIGDRPFSVTEFERVVAESIIEPMDHKHLNLEVDEFLGGGLNPSVENIAKVCYDRLARALAASASGASLRSVTVWETDKTRCTYPAR